MLNLFLLLAALVANHRSAKMLALTICVGASVFVSVPKDSYELFYYYCMCGELTVALAAISLRARASTAVIALCVIMFGMHIIGLEKDGSLPFSPYKLLIPILEHAQLVACLLLSEPFIGKVKNHEPPTI